MPTLLDRYLAGDHLAVWAELTKLGKAVRDKRHYADASAVATETMRRARHNVELLIQRLDAIGFRFLTQELNNRNHSDSLRRLQQIYAKIPRHLDWIEFLRSNEARTAVAFAAGQSRAAATKFCNKVLAGKPAPLKNPDVWTRPDKNTTKQLDKLEKAAGGPMPLSLRAWYEQVGGVCFLGWHSELCPNADEPAGLAGRSPDPLLMFSLSLGNEILEELDEGEYRIVLAPDDIFKAGEAGGDAYWIGMPNPAADATFEDGAGRSFVNYLRHAFACGGFPGWHKKKNAPREILAKLAEGLLPI
jgi:hypothetical protein